MQLMGRSRQENCKVKTNRQVRQECQVDSIAFWPLPYDPVFLGDLGGSKTTTLQFSWRSRGFGDWCMGNKPVGGGRFVRGQADGTRQLLLALEVYRILFLGGRRTMVASRCGGSVCELSLGAEYASEATLSCRLVRSSRRRGRNSPREVRARGHKMKGGIVSFCKTGWGSKSLVVGCWSLGIPKTRACVLRNDRRDSP